MRRTVGESESSEFFAPTSPDIRSLEEARRYDDGLVVMESDTGEVYLAVPVRMVRCDKPTLCRLLRDLREVFALGCYKISFDRADHPHSVIEDRWGAAHIGYGKHICPDDPSIGLDGNDVLAVLAGEKKRIERRG